MNTQPGGTSSEDAQNDSVKLDDADILAELEIFNEPSDAAPAEQGMRSGNVVLDAEGIPEPGSTLSDMDSPPPLENAAPHTHRAAPEVPVRRFRFSILFSALQRLRENPWKIFAACSAAALIAAAAGWLMAGLFLTPGAVRIAPEPILPPATDENSARAAADALFEFDLDPFILPLHDATNDPVFLRITIRLHTAASDMSTLDNNLDAVRRAAYMVMKQHAASDYFNSSIVENIRREVRHAINQALLATIVGDVSFVDLTIV